MAVSQLTDRQLRSLETVERVASCFSLVGTIVIFVTFVSSSNFRRPINRLIFAASWGNTLGNIATLLSLLGVRAGQKSHLCQFQAFLIQTFLTADAFWNFAIAINVYMTLFKNYNAEQLKALEWKYHIMCYGTPFIIGLTCIFIETESRGRIYGPAILWCWISNDWAFLRVALLYAPVWVCITCAFTIYVISGREIFKKRKQLRQFNNFVSESTFTGYKTTDVQITSELASQSRGSGVPGSTLNPSNAHGCKANANSNNGYEAYTVNIASVPLSPRPRVSHATSSGSVYTSRLNRAAMEANTAAWGYTKVAILFFVSLLVTWLPSSINRLYSLVHPDSISVPLTYTAGTVLSLMGFWNSVIYMTTSRAACKTLFYDICAPFKRPKVLTGGNDDKIPLGRREIVALRQSHASDSDEGLAEVV